MKTSPIETIESPRAHYRHFVMRKPSEIDPQGERLKQTIHNVLGIKSVTSVRVGTRYDFFDISSETNTAARQQFLYNEITERVLDEQAFTATYPKALLVTALPGQYVVTADYAQKALDILDPGTEHQVSIADVYIFEGAITREEMARIKAYLINSFESQETTNDAEAPQEATPASLDSIISLEGFQGIAEGELADFKRRHKLAMSTADIKNVQAYFASKDRDPTITELKVIDMYWSDHCRHLTFTTPITRVRINGAVALDENGLTDINDATRYTKTIAAALGEFHGGIEKLAANNNHSFSLMDIATSAMKEMQLKGSLNHLENSEENNAASIEVEVAMENGNKEQWLFMFKNETHNHPTQIAPFGGAATCIGGVIRDPLSGRAYVFMAMRVTGGADPRTPIEETLPDRLPSVVIAQEAARGFASYGNQIGVPTVAHANFYHPDFAAKRFEAGFVGGAVRKDHVVRETPKAGDVVILLGGRTGRDGINAAAGSSKTHTIEVKTTANAEVQKGNPITERAILRLFHNPAALKLIKKCNDFGAGGVANAIGELAPGISINLDTVPLKYTGLDGTEIALSESQERMAIVISAEHVEEFVALANAENLEATTVAKIESQATDKLQLHWQGQTICDLDREFLEGGWAARTAEADITTPEDLSAYFDGDTVKTTSLVQRWQESLADVKNCSRRGETSRFDHTVGNNTIMGPFGGKYETSPNEAGVCKFPTEGALTGMTVAAGFDPDLSKSSPFHGGMMAIVDSIARTVAVGGRATDTSLGLQNYFPTLTDAERWSRPLCAQLGANVAQKALGVAAITGKDSASGSFITGDKRYDVPTTLVSFATAQIDIRKTIPSCFQKANSKVVYIDVPYDDDHVPVWDKLNTTFQRLYDLGQAGKLRSCHAIHAGGIASAITEMTLGNGLGANLNKAEKTTNWFAPKYGSFVVEIAAADEVDLSGLDYQVLGTTTLKPVIVLPTDEELSITDAKTILETPFDPIFPLQPQVNVAPGSASIPPRYVTSPNKLHKVSFTNPQALFPVFPGTNSEKETAEAFARAGAKTREIVMTNLTANAIETAAQQLIRELRQSQLLVLSGGFSGADEPRGSGKYAALMLRRPDVRDAIDAFLHRDGLILGICNGFQILTEAKLLGVDHTGRRVATLTDNTLGHYISGIAPHLVTSNRSPWMRNYTPGEIVRMPVAHGEGRVVLASTADLTELTTNGQIPFCYGDPNKGTIATTFPNNPNGSFAAIAGLTDESQQILALMAHPERAQSGRLVDNHIDQDRIISAGVTYFK